MPEYQILITKTAQKQLDRLPDSIAGLLIETIQELSVNPRPHGSKKLKGRKGYRIRKGDFRIIYDIIDRILTVEVIAIGNRKDIYD
ncbi:MAG: type II toxin-antitoxin system RelE/ParE family toxin [Chitinophagaceae bacterium]